MTKYFGYAKLLVTLVETSGGRSGGFTQNQTLPFSGNNRAISTKRVNIVFTTALASVVTLPTFDLGYIVEQLMDKPAFKNWTPERFGKAVSEYRSLLYMCKLGQKAIPTQDADEIWHRHILNTRQYMADCKTYLGHYLHHQPRTITRDEWRDMTAQYQNVGVTVADCADGSCSGDGCTP